MSKVNESESAMKKTTEELLLLLKNTSNINTYLQQQKDSIHTLELPEALEQLLTEKSISKGDCIRRSGLDRTYCYQIFSGIKRPSRDKLLALCFAMSLTADEAQTLLKQTGYVMLYAKNERDSVILFSLYHKLTLTATNELLFDIGLPPIE